MSRATPAITLEPGAPEHVAMLAAWINAGQQPSWEHGDWDVHRLVTWHQVDWPVGYAPIPHPGALAILELFRCAE